MNAINAVPEREKGISGIRYLFTTLGFLGFCVIYTIRVGINIAIVAMINSTVIENNASEECNPNSSLFNIGDSTEHKNGEFNWSSTVQNYVLGSFYVGYCISQIPGGRLAETYNAKNVFGFGTVITALLSLVTPIAARWNVILLIFIRVIEGLAQGVTMPAMHSMIGRWLPDSEMGFLSTIIYNGISIGTVIAMPVAGVLCSSNIFGGWPSVFYIFGISGCIWFVLWMTFVTNTPVTHPLITVRELKYITDNQNVQQFQKLPYIPWKAILSSVPVWALIITQFGQDWCFYTFLTDLPTFLNIILHFQIETDGLVMCMPYIFQTVVSVLVGYVTDFCIRRKHCSTQFVRKFCNTVSSVGTIFGLIGLCLSGCNVKLTVTMFILSNAIGGFCNCGYMLSHLDLSPEYAGTLMGLANTISNLSGFIAPAVVGSLTENQQTLRQWHIVFLITIIIVTATSIVFLFFSTTKKQDWSLEAQNTV